MLLKAFSNCLLFFASPGVSQKSSPAEAFISGDRVLNTSNSKVLSGKFDIQIFIYLMPMSA